MCGFAEDDTVPLQQLVRLGIGPFGSITLGRDHRRMQRPPSLGRGRSGAAAAKVGGLVVHAAQRLALVVGLRAAAAVLVGVGP